MKRVAAAVIGLALIAAGCQVSEGSGSQETLPPLGTPSNTRPPTTVAETVADTEQLPTSTIGLPGGACVFAGPPAAPQVTFEVATRLYTLNPIDGTTSCLSELTAGDAGPLRWSPAGDRVLLNSVTVFDGTQALPTGYLATNDGVSWSYPTGSALIAPAVADDHLLWRAAGQPETRTDISFLARTDVAAYHPAGKNIFAAGQAGDGSSGLFVAGNRGQNPRLIARLDQPAARVTEIGPDPNGVDVYYIHDHHDGTFHLHSLLLTSLTATDVVTTTGPIAKLTISNVASADVAYRLGDCSTVTRTQVADGAGGIVDQPAAFAAQSTEPVGWVGPNELVLSVRQTGCAGPSDLWNWNTATSVATPLINGVDTVAVRSVLTAPGDMPGDLANASPE